MKLTLRQKEYIAGAVFAAGLLLMLMCGESIPLLLLGMAVALGAGALNFAWWRCPNCGRHLGRSHGQFCPNCGREIDYDGAEKR